jgi:hypothetical protein
VGHSTVTTNTSTGSGPSGELTNLASIGYIETSYLTGSARDYGDVIANITLGDWTDEQGNTVSTTTGSYVNLQVDAYGGPQVIRTPVTFGVSTGPGVPNTSSDSRLFRNYIFSFNYLSTALLPQQQITPAQTFVVVDGNMATDEVSTGAVGTAPFTPQTYPAYVRAFPGRFSSVTVRVDPNTIGLNFQPYTDANGFQWGPSQPRGIFEATQFSTINFPNSSNQTFDSVLSDYLSFDVSNMVTLNKGKLASLPYVTQNGLSVYGMRVFFSGDTYGIADSTNAGNFFQLTEDISTGGAAYLPGTFNTNGQLNGYPLPSGSTAFLPGTYALNEIDPSDPSFLRKILSLEGEFLDYTKMIKSPSSVVAITFPGSLDNNVQDVVLFKTNTSGQIVDFYYGYIDFEAYELYLYPLSTLVTAIPTTTQFPLGYAHGKISASTDYNLTGAATGNEQDVRSGALTLDTPLVWQDGTNSTFQAGRFIVYRR